MAIVGVGILAGYVGAAIGARLIGGLLVGVSPVDLRTYGIVGLAMVLAGLGACCLPAWRAMRVRAIVALRYE